MATRIYRQIFVRHATESSNYRQFIHKAESDEGPMQARTRVAVAVTAMSMAAVGGAVGAAGAQAQNEVLQATATTFSGGGSGLCLNGSASATFSAAGPATGRYPGTFTETNANVSVVVRLLPGPYFSRTLTLSIPFTISSGSTTITGAITNPPPYAGGSILCGGGSFPAGGPIVGADGATYTATIQSEGQRARTVTGTAEVSAAFEFRPRYILGASPTATLLNFPSP